MTDPADQGSEAIQSRPGLKHLSHEGRKALHVTGSLLDTLNAPTPVLHEHAETMTQVAKVSYTHDAMIDLVIERPAISQNEIARHFGYSVSWVSHIFASDAFQMRMAQRKDELTDPTIRRTIEERFKAIVARSLDVLQEKLASPAGQIPDQLALQAAALGARALGLGRDAPPQAAPAADRLTILANRLIVLQSDVKRKVQNGEIQDAEVISSDAGGGISLGAGGEESGKDGSE